MDDKPFTHTVNEPRTRDPIDVIARLDRGKEGPVPAGREVRSGFEMAWDLAH